MKLFQKVVVGVGILFVLAQLNLSAESNEDKLTKKLSTKFVSASNWISDFDKAREKAKKENKPIFAYFTRSYEP